MITKLKTRIGALLLAGALVVGCRDNTAEIVDPIRHSSASPSLDAAPDNAANQRAAIDDLVGRVVPALSDAADARPLAIALHGLSEALNNGRAGDAPGMTTAIQGAVDRYAELHPADAADVDAIRLALVLFVSGT